MTTLPNDAAFDEFFRSHFRALCKFLVTLGAGMDDAHDASQTVFLKLHQRWSDVESPRSWIYQAAFHERINILRKSQSQRRAHDKLCREFLDGEPEQPDAQYDLVVKSLHALTDNQREVVALTLAGYWPREIAAKIGIKAGTVSSRLHAAVSKLKDHIGHGLGELS